MESLDLYTQLAGGSMGDFLSPTNPLLLFIALQRGLVNLGPSTPGGIISFLSLPSQCVLLPTVQHTAVFTQASVLNMGGRAWWVAWPGCSC